jgi:hypothetical protein
VYEQALDRISIALGGKAVLPPAFQYIPGMLVNHDWRLRHAGLMAIAAIAEGTNKVMQKELGKVVECAKWCLYGKYGKCLHQEFLGSLRRCLVTLTPAFDMRLVSACKSYD